MKDASAMLEEIDKILNVLRVDADILDINVKRKCRVCGLGEYVIIVQNDEHLLGDIGLSPTPGHGYYVFECNNCGHVQLFHFKGDKLPPGWL